MSEFLGHFHPLLVHLPIGILVIGLIFKLLSLKSKDEKYDAVLPTLLLASFVSSGLAAGSGYLLSSSGGYDITLLNNHKYAGIGLVVFTGILYLLSIKNQYQQIQKVLWVAVGTILFITGHLGGSLTHGEDYLSFDSKNYEKPAIEDIQKALVYEQIIEPIFAEKCWSCHAAKKQKGGLRLDGKAFISQGGENGKVILAHQAQNSPIFQRAMLDNDDEKHMPPAGKPQLNQNEIKLIEWWINQGADFDKTVAQLNQNAEIKAVLQTLTQEDSPKSKPDLPISDAKAANPTSVDKLKNAGITLLPVAENSTYLLVNFNNKTPDADSWNDLKVIAENIVWLKAKNCKLTDNQISVIGAMKNLTQLDLSYTSVTDKQLQALKQLSELRFLVLNSTAITENGLLVFKESPKLRSIYLFQTNVNRQNWDTLKAKFPKTRLDSGNYKVPTFETDTTRVKKEDIEV